MRLSLLSAVLAGLILFPATAAQACKPAILDIDNSLSIIGTSVETGSTVTGSLKVRVGNEAEDATVRCAATLRISRIGAALTPDTPAYVVRAPGNNNVEILPEGALGGSPRADIPLPGLLDGRNGRNVAIFFDVPITWGMRAGTYTEQLMLSLHDEQGALIGQSAVNLSITVPNIVAVRFAGAVEGQGQASRLDLGRISRTVETRSAPFAIRILSTSPYAVSFTSANGGALRQDGGAERIPYQLYLDGRRVNADGAAVLIAVAHTAPTGDVRPMAIVVPPIVATAGTYSDRLTVQVTAI